MPPWFGQARAAIARELDEAAREVGAIIEDRQRRRTDIAAATQRVRDAQAACEPFDDRVANARHLLDTAIIERDVAAERVARARFRDRRDARTDLTHAQHAVTAPRPRSPPQNKARSPPAANGGPLTPNLTGSNAPNETTTFFTATNTTLNESATSNANSPPSTTGTTGPPASP